MQFKSILNHLSLSHESNKKKDEKKKTKQKPMSNKYGNGYKNL